MLRVLIVDDEPLARENLRVLLQEQSDIEVVGECANAIEGIGAVHKLRPDVLFLDIQMPRISGLEMVGMLDPEHRPYIVFLTAFDEYAVKAFEEHAFDYLLKPIEEKRLEKTLTRLRQERTAQDVTLLPEHQQPLKFIPCTGHSRIYLLQMDDVAFVSSRLSGVYVTSAEGNEGFTELTLRTLESRTPLIRCHRQYLVNMAHLKEIRLEDNGQAELVLRAGQTVPVSRRYLKSLKEAIGCKTDTLRAIASSTFEGSMLSNDILRSLRYTLKANNNDMVRILALSDMESTSAGFDTWMTKEDEEGFVRCPDIILSGFLNGLIYDKRGKDESAPELALERRVNNNTVLKKLRIAFCLKTDDILAIMTEQKFRVSMPEITAMMRAPDHKNYRECGDQFLRYFLRGLTQRVHNQKG